MEKLVLDLKKLAEHFIRTNRQSFERENSRDEAAIQAINGAGMKHADREERVLQWLHSYRVLLFFPPENSRAIAGEIIKFADEHRHTRRPLGKDLVISEHERLRERIRHVAPHSLKTGKPREVTSLTSKALWCCYPYDVPILDSYALRALQVISRLSRMTTGENQSEYACFVDAWFQVYDEVEPVIELAGLDGYPYKVRVLDRLLWYLGQPNFDTPCGGA